MFRNPVKHQLYVIFVFVLMSVPATANKKRAWSWPAYLEEGRTIAAPVKLFKEVQTVILPSLHLNFFCFNVVSYLSNLMALCICLAAPIVSSKQEQF